MFLNYGTEIRNWNLWRDWYLAKRGKSQGGGSLIKSGSKGTIGSRGHASTHTANSPTRHTMATTVQSNANSRVDSRDQEDLMKGGMTHLISGLLNLFSITHTYLPMLRCLCLQ
jgi:hypothetical protein